MNNNNELHESASLVNTPPELINTTIEKVHRILTEHFPDHLSFGNGSFTITRGSCQVMVIVRPFTNEETCVECISHVVTGARINDDLMKFLLRKNAEIHYGAFGLLFDDTITFSHSLSGSTLDTSELKIALDTVSIIADHYDDIIVDLAGGKRAADLVEDFSLGK